MIPKALGYDGHELEDQEEVEVAVLEERRQEHLRGEHRHDAPQRGPAVAEERFSLGTWPFEHRGKT